MGREKKAEPWLGCLNETVPWFRSPRVSYSSGSVIHSTGDRKHRWWFRSSIFESGAATVERRGGGEGRGREGVISGDIKAIVFLTLSLLENFLELEGEGEGGRGARDRTLFLRAGRRGFVLRTGTEDLAASIATAGELGVVAIPAVDLVHLATELFVHQGHSAPVAQETGLVPMLILVRQILQTRHSVFFHGD